MLETKGARNRFFRGTKSFFIINTKCHEDAKTRKKEEKIKNKTQSIVLKIGTFLNKLIKGT